MASESLIDAFLRAERQIQTTTGYGRITVTFRLDRDPEIEVAVTERVAA